MSTYLSSFRINDTIVVQSIDLDNDTVSFENKETDKVIFTMDHDCKTFYHNPNSEKKFIGKFRYCNKQHIDFLFNEMLQNKVQTIGFSTRDFIKAEEMFVKQVLKDYPDVFKL